MWHFFHHWIYQDLWQPVWPNWFAGAVVGFLAWIWGRAFEKRQIERHEDLKAHVSKEHEKSRKHLEKHVHGN